MVPYLDISAGFAVAILLTFAVLILATIGAGFHLARYAFRLARIGRYRIIRRSHAKA